MHQRSAFCFRSHGDLTFFCWFLWIYEQPLMWSFFEQKWTPESFHFDVCASTLGGCETRTTSMIPQHVAHGWMQNFILVPEYDVRIGPKWIEQKLLSIKSDCTNLGSLRTTRIFDNDRYLPYLLLFASVKQIWLVKVLQATLCHDSCHSLTFLNNTIFHIFHIFSSLCIWAKIEWDAQKWL